jgi:uncharacterized membrane protein
MANKQDLVKKLNELMSRSEALHRDLKELNNLIVYSDLISDTKAEAPVASPPPAAALVTPPPVATKQQEAVPAPVKQQEEWVFPAAVEHKATAAPIQEVPKPAVAKQNPTAAKRKSFLERNPDLEKFIGERLITFIGIAILVIGISFFVKFAIDQDWINETGRTFIGILSGGVLLGIAHRLRKSFTTFSSILVGGGIAVLYFSISYSYHVYHLLPQTATFCLLVLITGFTVFLSTAYDRKELAVLAILGGYGSPLMIANGSGNFPVLCSYILLLNTGMLLLAYYRKWNIVNLVSYGFTILLFGAAVILELRKPAPAYTLALVFSTAYYLTFFCMNIVNNLKKKTTFQASEIAILLSNSFLFYAVGYAIVNQIHQGAFLGLFTLCAAGFNLSFVYFLYKRQDVDRNLIFFLIGLVLTFVSLAGPVQLHGHYITLFWAAEAVLLLWLYQRTEIKLMRTTSAIINFLMLASLVMDWMTIYGGGSADSHFMPIVFNKAFIASAFCLASLLLSTLLLKKNKEELFWANGMRASQYRQLITGIFLVLLYLSGLWEVRYQYISRTGSYAGEAIAVAVYTSLFILSFLVVFSRKQFTLYRVPAVLLGLFALVLFLLFPNSFVIDARDGFLSGLQPAEQGAFLLHYANTTLLLAIVFLTNRLFFSLDIWNKNQKTVCVWFICLILVYAGSTELDHFLVYCFYNVAHPDIVHSLELSHKIGYPVLWGLLSFAIMVRGMQKRNRQLRISSLSLFFLTVVKLITLGFSGNSEAGKIIAFISSGVILLVVAFMYQKLKKIFSEDEQSVNQTPHETETL